MTRRRLRGCSSPGLGILGVLLGLAQGLAAAQDQALSLLQRPVPAAAVTPAGQVGCLIAEPYTAGVQVTLCVLERLLGMAPKTGALQTLHSYPASAELDKGLRPSLAASGRDQPQPPPTMAELTSQGWAPCPTPRSLQQAQHAGSPSPTPAATLQQTPIPTPAAPARPPASTPHPHSSSSSPGGAGRSLAGGCSASAQAVQVGHGGLQLLAQPILQLLQPVVLLLLLPHLLAQLGHLLAAQPDRAQQGRSPPPRVPRSGMGQVSTLGAFQQGCRWISGVQPKTAGPFPGAPGPNSATPAQLPTWWSTAHTLAAAVQSCDPQDRAVSAGEDSLPAARALQGQLGLAGLPVVGAGNVVQLASAQQARSAWLAPQAQGQRHARTGCWLCALRMGCAASGADRPIHPTPSGMHPQTATQRLRVCRHMQGRDAACSPSAAHWWVQDHAPHPLNKGCIACDLGNTAGTLLPCTSDPATPFRVPT